MRQTFQKFHLIRFGLLVFLTLSGLSAFSLSHAAGYTAFGPQVYLRQRGRPVIEEDSFVSAVSGSFILKIYNGGLEGDEYDLVSSAEIYLNNTKILSPNELNQNVDYLEKTITVQSVNDLSVELRGKPGAALVIEIEGDDAVFPVITSSIVPSANTNGWHLSDPTVSFICSDVGSAIASCSSPVNVINEGASQVIMGTAIDLAGNTAAVSETINLDKSLPVLSISSPARDRKSVV
jgi:hypothetical protein